MRICLRALLLAMVLLAGPTATNAATLLISNGILTGATGVNVDGTMYNVAFLDGTCIELFHGCDSVSDFDFRSEGAATRASAALLEQVFIDGPQGLFDSTPSLTRGCPFHPLFSWLCQALTPYELGFLDPSRPDVYMVGTMKAINYSAQSGFPDRVFPQGFERDNDHAAPYEVYALWSVVPEPATLGLLALGLLGLGFTRCKR